jgi:CDP-paratose 2-epimerase
VKICITGVAGFVGSQLARSLAKSISGVELFGIDNLSRRGSETNLKPLASIGCKFIHGDVRSGDDIAALPKCDWLIDCAAIPSVMAGLQGDSAQLVGNNLSGTLNLLEKCRRDQAGFLLLSTSRVYSIPTLLSIPLKTQGDRFVADAGASFPAGSSQAGISHEFSTVAPVSLYGATKLASEIMAMEYAHTYGFPLWINRCGVIAGPGQFGKIDQGVISFWMYQWLCDRPLSYIGFGGEGRQVRDFLSPVDLGELVATQLRDPGRACPKIVNVGGGTDCSVSLAELSTYCRQRFGVDRKLGQVPETRPFDVPYYITDNSRLKQYWNWSPRSSRQAVLDSIADWATANLETIRAGF